MLAVSGSTNEATPFEILRSASAVSIIAGSAAIEEAVVNPTVAPGVIARANFPTGTRTNHFTASGNTVSAYKVIATTTETTNIARLRSASKPRRAAIGATRHATPSGASTMIQ